MTKMLIDRSTVEQALEALEKYRKMMFVEAGCRFGEGDAAITTLRAALAEPEQEPIGYLWPTGRHPEFRFTQQKRDGVDGTPVYATPSQRKPLTITEESAWDLARYVYARSNPHESPQILLSAMEIKQIIERAHKIGVQP